MYAQKHLKLGDNRLNYPVLPSTLDIKGISTFVCELGKGEEGIATYQVRLRQNFQLRRRDAGKVAIILHTFAPKKWGNQ